MMELLKNKKVLAVIVAVIILLLLLFIAGQKNQPETAPEFTEEFGPATILNGEEAIRDMGLESFTYFRNDVTYLARNKIEPYQNKNNQIVFTITAYSKNDSTLTVDGVYEELSESSVTFLITLLANDKIKNEYSINNVKGDLALPSTSKDNVFIGSLPIQKDGFKISYLDVSETFYVTFNRPVDQALLREVRSYLRANLDEELSFYRFTSLGEDENGRIRSFTIAEESIED